MQKNKEMTDIETVRKSEPSKKGTKKVNKNMELKKGEVLKRFEKKDKTKEEIEQDELDQARKDLKAKKFANKARYKTNVRLSRKVLRKYIGEDKKITDLAIELIENKLTERLSVIYSCADEYREKILNLKEINERSINFALNQK